MDLVKINQAQKSHTKELIKKNHNLKVKNREIKKEMEETERKIMEIEPRFFETPAKNDMKKTEILKAARFAQIRNKYRTKTNTYTNNHIIEEDTK